MKAEDLGGLKIPIEDLIEALAPLNNEIRAATRSRQPAYVALELMWDAGDILIASGVERIHPLAWAVEERSYITRDLLSYCFRVRKYFGTREEIQERFGGVPVYGVFREAFPLLNNERYKLDEAGERQLVELMTSGRQPSQINDEIIEMKKRLVARPNPRTQRLGEVEPLAEEFASRLARLSEVLDAGTLEQALFFRESFSDATLFFWSKLCLTLSSDTFVPPAEHVVQEGLDQDWAGFLAALFSLASSGKEARSRLRRLVPIKDILRMGSYVNILRSPEKVRQYMEKIATAKRPGASAGQ